MFKYNYKLNRRLFCQKYKCALHVQCMFSLHVNCTGGRKMHVFIKLIITLRNQLNATVGQPSISRPNKQNNCT